MPRKTPFNPQKIRRAGILVAILMAVFLLAVGGSALVSGKGEWRTAITSLNATSVILLLVGMVGGVALRMLRYPVLMHALHMRVPFKRVALYYLAGMAFVPTPGKIGTALRIWLLWQHHGIPLYRTAPLLVLDTLTDFIALMLVIGLSLPFLGNLAGMGIGLVLLGGMLAGVVCLFLYPALIRWGIKLLYLLSGKRKPRLFARLLLLTASLRLLFGWRTLLATVSLSTVAWGMQFLLLHLVLVQMGAPVTASATVFSTATSIVLGGISFLPGGLGGTEATLISLLHVFGSPVALAVAFTILMRIATLWLPVVLGFLLLPSALRPQKTRKR